MSCLSDSSAISVTSVAALWLTSVIVLKAVPSWLQLLSLTGFPGSQTLSLDVWQRPLNLIFFFSFLCRSVIRPNSNKLWQIWQHHQQIWSYLLVWANVIKLGKDWSLKLFQRRMRRETQCRNEDSGQELTSCQSTLRARRPYCTAVTPSGEYSGGRRWVLVLYVGDIITAWTVTPRDAKLNQADSPAASGSFRVYSY